MMTIRVMMLMTLRMTKMLIIIIIIIIIIIVYLYSAHIHYLFEALYKTNPKTIKFTLKNLEIKKLAIYRETRG